MTRAGHNNDQKKKKGLTRSVYTCSARQEDVVKGAPLSYSSYCNQSLVFYTSSLHSFAFFRKFHLCCKTFMLIVHRIKSAMQVQQYTIGARIRLHNRTG